MLGLVLGLVLVLGLGLGLGVGCWVCLVRCWVGSVRCWVGLSSRSMIFMYCRSFGLFVLDM